jgi:hypothetical protein
MQATHTTAGRQQTTVEIGKNNFLAVTWLQIAERLALQRSACNCFVAIASYKSVTQLQPIGDQHNNGSKPTYERANIHAFDLARSHVPARTRKVCGLAICNELDAASDHMVDVLPVATNIKAKGRSSHAVRVHHDLHKHGRAHHAARAMRKLFTPIFTMRHKQTLMKLL